MDYKFKFSIIMAVYNVEDYLSEAIDSIISQDIGFKNVQLILVDDGSPDNSGAICDKYQKKYPNNIFVIHKKNGGVSSARNEGLKIAEGKYINFIDSDDMFTKNTLSDVDAFFEANYDEIDMVAVPLIWFEGKKGNHVLNYKFEEGTRVVDLENEWDIVQMNVSSGFLKSEVMKKFSFDETLAYAEDAKIVQRVLLRKRKLGLVDTCQYLYRSRKTTSSAIQTAGSKANWYMPVLEGFHEDTIKYCLETCGYVPKFIQMNVMYDLQWRTKKQVLADECAGLSEEEKEEYLNKLKELLGYIDDDVIMAQRQSHREHKLFVFSLKYGRLPDCRKTKTDIKFFYSDDAIFKISRCRINIEFFKIENNRLTIEGHINLYNLPFEDVNVVVYVNGEPRATETFDRKMPSRCIDNVVALRHGFKRVIKLDQAEKYEITFGIRIDRKRVRLENLVFRYFSPFGNVFQNSYYSNGRWLATINEERTGFIVSHVTNEEIAQAEKRFIEEIEAKENERYKKPLRLRKKYFSKRKKKPLWVICDRFGKAGDNGEAFFKYMVKHHPEIDVCFVLSKKSPDFWRLSRIGRVIKYKSVAHKLAILQSDYIASSQGESEVFDPFGILGGERDLFRDILVKKRFVFIQHGVIKNDLSAWLQRFNKNVYGFITSAKAEKDSIVNGDYFYDEENVWLTGLPRFDRLEDKPKKIITIMPTWRKNLTGAYDFKTSTWEIAEDFKDSEYFKFFNALLTDEMLLRAAKEKGYKIQLVLHPNLTAAAKYFKKNSVVKIVSSNVDYKKIYKESNLVVTDYSSAIFDFAYLRKPIVYAQFDLQEFYGGNHTSKFGYFDDARDGFGEVEYTAEDTANRIIEYIENDCRLKEKYRERIDNFFAFSDRKNCERVYNKMMEK